MSEPVLPKRFRFIRQLGEGGMGIVYEALDEERGARVAVKTVRDLTADSLARFKREFRALADVHHPNVITLGELFSEGADWFFSMELVEGDDFLAYVRPAEARWRAVEALSGPAPILLSERAIAVAPTQRPPPGDELEPGFDEVRLPGDRGRRGQLGCAREASAAGGEEDRSGVGGNEEGVEDGSREALAAPTRASSAQASRLATFHCSPTSGSVTSSASASESMCR